MNAVLVNGWGVADRQAAAAIPRSPDAQLEVVAVAHNWREKLERLSGSVLLGYSTGAFLLLTAPELWRRFERVVLFAPFPDLKAESGQGGRVNTVQLRVMLRSLKQDPLAALSDFYQRAGLTIKGRLLLPQPAEELCWGIEQLLGTSADAAPMTRAECHVGECDPLLDATRLAELCPTITVVPGVGHDLRALVEGSGFRL
ncbi:MAG: hypothetical protein KDA37_02735 [Planctomycetales bacterium]|nr:hypothetical protein [Planctomycetales bacterium]